MRIGNLRHRVTLQRNTADKAAGGQVKPNWVDVADIWAQIKPLRGREAEYAKAIHDQTTHEVRLRYFVGLTAEHRFVYEGRVFNILGPPLNTDERNEEHICMCVEA